jgi:diadenosine tetraphosphate (Ap4A) HIT family hydrolase
MTVFEACCLAGVLATVVFVVKAGFKLWGPSVFNHYDEEGTVAGIPHTCIFCNIVLKHTEVVYEDGIVSVFPDKYPDAKHHFLVIPKRHIKNLMALRREDLELLEHMKNIGREVAEKFGFEESLVMGFHRSLFNSVLHLHLHVIGLPFTAGFLHEKVIFNRINFVSIDDVINGYKQKRS